MTGPGLLGAAGVVFGILVAAGLILPSVRRSGLGIVHPAVAWLVLHAVFFGVGLALLAAMGQVQPAAAWYAAGAAGAAAIGTYGSDRLARRRGAGSIAAPSPVASGSVDASPVRPILVAVLVGVALGAVAPALLASGLPLLAEDPTSARTELAGLAVQPLRIALPTAAIVALLAAVRAPRPRRIAAAVAVIALSIVFTLLLASRYLAAELVASLAIAWILAGRRVDLRAVAIVAVVAAVTFGTVQVVRAPERSAGRELAFALERSVSRVVLVQPRTIDALMAVIPAETPFFGGATWLRRAGPLVGDDTAPNLGYWIYPRLFPDQDPGVRGYAAPGLIGEAWANLGLAGLVLFAGLGLVLERAGVLIARRRGGTADLAAAAVLIVVVARTHALGLNGTAVLLVLLVAWRVVAGRNVRGLLGDVGDVCRWRA